MTDTRDVLKDPRLRIRASAALNRFDKRIDNRNYYHLTLLLGKDPIRPLEYQFTDEDRNICRMLDGPYGYSIFKMLCIQRGITIQQNTDERVKFGFNGN